MRIIWIAKDTLDDEDKIVLTADDAEAFMTAVHHLRHEAMINALAKCTANKEPVEEIRYCLNEAHDRYKVEASLDAETSYD